MTNTISLKHNSSAFFKEQMCEFRKNTQKGLRLLKADVNSISLDSPKAYSSFIGENVLQTAIPRNFYDDKALNESEHGDTYAVFPEFKEREVNGEKVKGEKVTLFGIKQGLAERGVLDQPLQDRLINLMLQCRVAILFGVAQPIQQLAAVPHNIIIASKPDKLNLSVEVQDPEHLTLKIEMPMQTLAKETGLPEQIGILHCELSITTSSIYLKEMTYTKTGDSPIAKKLLEIISADYSWLSEIWSRVKEFFGLIEQKAEFELSPPRPSR